MTINDQSLDRVINQAAATMKRHGCTTPSFKWPTQVVLPAGATEEHAKAAERILLAEIKRRGINYKMPEIVYQ